MVATKKIRILSGKTAGVAGAVHTKLFRSVYDSLKYEKSIQILADGSPETADFILPVSDATEEKMASGTAAANTPLICAPPTTHTMNITHSLNAGESLHGYFKYNNELLTLHHLPLIEPTTVYALPKLLGPAADAQYAIAHELQQRLNLQGPWHSIATSADKLTVHTYPAPEKTPFFNALGINWYALAAFEAAGKPISILQQNLRGTVRFTREGQTQIQISCSAVYLDLDDTLIIHGAVNGSILVMLDECERTNTPVHLITRHARDPQLTLGEHGIPATRFASIIWITDGSPKSSHITAEHAIFIDDAFQERVEVSANTGTIVLPPESSETIDIS